MKRHTEVFLRTTNGLFLEGIGVLEDVDDALCSLIKMSNTIMQFRDKVSRTDKVDSVASSDDKLRRKFNEQMHHFIQKKTILHELRHDVLGIDNEQNHSDIQALLKKRVEVAIVEKIRKDLL